MNLRVFSAQRSGSEPSSMVRSSTCRLPTPPWALSWSKKSCAPRLNCTPSCAAGPVKGADCPSTMRPSACARARWKPPSATAPRPMENRLRPGMMGPCMPRPGLTLQPSGTKHGRGIGGQDVVSGGGCGGGGSWYRDGVRSTVESLAYKMWFRWIDTCLPSSPAVDAVRFEERHTKSPLQHSGRKMSMSLTKDTTSSAPIQVRGACPHDCPDSCALLTTVENGVATRVQGNPGHPHTDGVLCTKVARYTERSYHAERLLVPLRRSGPKGSGQFVPVSWDQALADIAGRLQAIAARAPEAILPYSYAGTMGLVQGESMDRRFFHRLGASQLERTICASAGAEALAQTLGDKVGMKLEFFAQARLILIWGSNPIGRHLHFWRYAQQAKRNGARLVCIDPRKTETADKCHEHLALRPGTDAALALALMHELIRNDWLDHDYIRAHTLGWEQLRERALQRTPERAADVCWLPVAQIRQLARDYGSTGPAAIRLNYGMQRVRGAGNAVRAVVCLPALTGAWRDPAGGVLLSSAGQFPVRRAVLQRPDLMPARRPRSINMSTIGDDLLRPTLASFGPQIEAVIVYNSNPVAVAPP